MASWLSIDPAEYPSYRGLRRIYELINQDGVATKRNCGQAAATTFLTYHGKLQPTWLAMRALEAVYPPNILLGYFGTSRRRVEAACRGHGVPLQTVQGEGELRMHLGQGHPVIVMLGMSAGRWLGVDWPGGHWMVAYGYDEDGVHLTNYGENRMPWAEFRAGWGSLVSRLIAMRNTGLVAVPEEDAGRMASSGK